MTVVDQAARDRIATELDTTLFVDAGAGSGKTSSLVKRVVALVTERDVALESVAAITFTEKAAGELRDRIRVALEERSEGDADPAVRDACATAIDQLDSAAIGTLHAFARRILSRHAIGARLPPRIDVLDEVSSGVAFEHRWTTLRDQLLDDDDLARTLQLLMATGVRIGAIRHLAATFDDNWDLVAELVPETAVEPPPVVALAGPALDALAAACRERETCTDPTDALAIRLGGLHDHVARLRMLDDELELLGALDVDGDDKKTFQLGSVGRAKAWGCPPKEVRDRVKGAIAGLTDARCQMGVACVRRLAVRLRAATVAAADDRRRAGRLEFHDLLVLARSLLADPDQGAEVRNDLHHTYRYLLLDEFQDTDPIQIELAVRIAAADPTSSEAGTAPWWEVPVTPGQLFVVGDPKQSIYRFRRADVALFLRARDRYGPDAGGPIELTVNFRTAGPIIGWINDTFAPLFAEGAAVDTGDIRSQPDYLPLDRHRPTAETGPPVSVIGRHPCPSDTRADDLRDAEATDVAATVTQVLAEGWTVDDGAGGWRPALLGDITILVPTRTSLPFLERHLEAADIGFRAEASSLVYATRAVRDLLMVLRAVDDPTDDLRIVSALRTPLLGCADDELYTFRVMERGHWNYLAPQPDTVAGDDRVAQGLAYLRALHDRRAWSGPAELADRVLRDRRAMELGFAERRPRDVWRRLRWVVDQARGWSDVIGGPLRSYLQWIDQQNADGARVAEAVLPETDDDAVRILTIHAAKGLEFPVTIVTGMSTRPQHRPAAAEVVFRPGEPVGYRVGSHITTPEWEAWAPIDEQMGLDERIRLLYVACTRARDHLVVSLHRAERASEPAKAAARTSAELLIEGMGARVADVPDAGQRHPLAVDPARSAVATVLSLADWRDARDRALVAARVPVAVAATALTDESAPEADDLELEGDGDPRLQKRQRDLDLPPWLKGRYGTAVGRAVHGVLQVVDLATGAGLDDAVVAQCEAEAIPNRREAVAALVVAALDAPSVRQAAHSTHWREVYAATPLADGRLLEGYLDLLYRRDDGLVIVDYKTSASSDAAEIDRRVIGYGAQGGAYRQMIAAITGEVVAGVVFVFLTAGGAAERWMV
ncbi:MAG: UvrD-helicase domain-containing protein [Acidimicrobiales bacterium]